MKLELTIAEVKDKINEASAEIKDILNELEKYTGCIVNSVDLERVEFIGRDSEILNLQLDVRI